ncbi:unnamed protein product [Boreogadus saida]
MPLFHCRVRNGSDRKGVIKEGKIMKRKKADIASFFRASGKKSAKAKNEGEMEKKQAESEDEEPPESSNLNGPPGIQYRAGITKRRTAVRVRTK